MNETDKWIGVDLDGTLAEYNDWIGIEHIGKAIPPMLERVKGWITEGKKVKIFTARVTAGHEAIKYIHEWLVTQGLPKLEVTNIKDFDMLELWDDRCISVVTNTGQVRSDPMHAIKPNGLEMLNELTPYSTSCCPCCPLKYDC